MSKLDPIIAEVLRNAFVSITREMKVTVLKTAYSSTVQEAQDFSVALFERSRLVAQAEGIAIHMGAFPYAIQNFLTKFPEDKLETGDIYIFNDPFVGGLHTPDVTVVGAYRIGALLFLPVVRAHWSDVGGMAPGSITGEARTIFQEGLRMPFIKIFQGGKPIDSVLDLIFANVRLPEQRAGDLRAQVAACNVAEDRLRSLINKYGENIVNEGVNTLLDFTEARIRSSINKLSDGVYEYEDYLDNDIHSEDPLRIHVSIYKNGTNIEVDFKGTSPQAQGPTNATLSGAMSATYLALKCIFDPKWPTNEGFFRPISIKAEPGTLVNALFPAATGSVTEVISRISDCILGALSSAVSEKVGASWCGSINHTFIGDSSKNYVWYEYPVGGRGATSICNGENALARMTAGDTKDLSIERAEAEYPLLCTLYELRHSSGGPGQYQGGLGLRKHMQVLEGEKSDPPVLSCLWDRCKIPPFGLNGGLSGKLQQIMVKKANGERIKLKGRSSLIPLHLGDTLCMETGGGGGFGNPLLVPPENILEEIRKGYISLELAQKIYGVVAHYLSSLEIKIDYQATELLRTEIQKNIIKAQAAMLEEESFLSNCRSAKCHQSLLNKIELSENSMVEVIGNSLQPLRVWLISDIECAEDTLFLDKVALQMLRISKGENVCLRNPIWWNMLENGGEKI